MDAETLASLPEGAIFTVLDEPFCAGGYAWWHLDFDGGAVGYMAEGVPGDYWLEPLPWHPPPVIGGYSSPAWASLVCTNSASRSSEESRLCWSAWALPVITTTITKRPDGTILL